MGLLSILKKVSGLVEVVAFRQISLRTEQATAVGNAECGLSIAAFDRFYLSPSRLLIVEYHYR